MTIPSYEKIMLPLLNYLEDKKECSKVEAIHHLSGLFKLTEDELSELLPSARQRIFDNRVGWARTYLKKAGLIEPTKRGYFRITSRGLSVLRDKPAEITAEYLKRFPEFIDFIAIPKRNKGEEIKKENLKQQTPEESLEYAYQNFRAELAQEVLNNTKGCSPIENGDFGNIVTLEKILLFIGYTVKIQAVPLSQRVRHSIEQVIRSKHPLHFA